jgi:hypothetical protein
VKNLSQNASRYAATSAKLMPPHRGTAHLVRVLDTQPQSLHVPFPVDLFA